MAIEEALLGSATDLVVFLGRIGLLIQALGIVIILWIVFQGWMVFLNRRRMKELYKIKEDIVRIEGKIDRILKKNK